jgi:hypothetical protein
MRKFSMVLAVVVVATVASIAAAQSIVFLDVRNEGSGNVNESLTTPVIPFTNGQIVGQNAFNGGGPGDGQILRLNPKVSNNFHLRNAWPNLDGDADLSTGKFHAYMQVDDDVSGTGDVISSLGLTAAISDAGAGGANRILASSWTLLDVNGGTPDWNGVANAAAGGDSPVSYVSKAVKVPVAGSPAMYNTTGGLVPTARYRVGELSIAAGNRTLAAANHAANSTFNVQLTGNTLLITRVYNGAGDTDEQVSLGYTNGVPNAAVSGNDPNASSAAPEGVIVIKMKGDTNGNGSVTGIDAPGFTAAFNAGAAVKQDQAYLYNNNGGTGGAATAITGIDAPVFTAAFGAPTP